MACPYGFTRARRPCHTGRMPVLRLSLYCTVNVTVVVCDSAPEVPVMVTV